MNKIISLSLFLALVNSYASGHGILINPISRSSAWRFNQSLNIVSDSVSNFY